MVQDFAFADVETETDFVVELHKSGIYRTPARAESPSLCKWIESGAISNVRPAFDSTVLRTCRTVVFSSWKVIGVCNESSKSAISCRSPRMGTASSSSRKREDVLQRHGLDLFKSHNVLREPGRRRRPRARCLPFRVGRRLMAWP